MYVERIIKGCINRMDQPTKSFNIQGGKNRLRFASAKFRAKYANADVYRSSDSRRTATSTGLREKRVHGTSFRSGDGGSKSCKKNKTDKHEMKEVRYFGRDNDAEGHGVGRTAVIVSKETGGNLAMAYDDAKGIDGQNIDVGSLEDEEVDQEIQTTELITGGTIFLTELEISAQRNGSQLYQKLVRELRPLCKSFAELLYHGERIVDLLYAYLLSPRGMKNEHIDSPTQPRKLHNESWKSYKNHLSNKVAPYGYSVNIATNEVLHLFGVLARELRREIYPFLTTRILPRIIDDMLNPPIVSTADSPDSLTFIPLDVSHIEAAFRAVSYLFKYNSDKLLHSHLPNNQSGEEKISAKQQRTVDDADILRQFYGKTICHKRDIARRLACEAYAPLLRKCSGKGLKRHLSRTVKALADSLAVSSGTDNSQGKRVRADAIDGVSSLLFEVSRGAPGRLHSEKGRLVAKTIMDCIIGFGSQKKTMKCKEGYDAQQLLALEKDKVFAVYEVASQFLYKVRGHVARRSQEEGHDMAGNAFAGVLDEMHRALDLTTTMMKELPSSTDSNAVINVYVFRHVIDLMTETIIFQDGRLLSNGFDRCGAADRVADSLQELLGQSIYSKVGHTLQEHILRYLCSAWRTNPGHSSFALRLGKILPTIISRVDADADLPETGLDPALFLCQNLLPYLPKKEASAYLIPAVLGAAASRFEKLDDSSLVLLHTISIAVWPKTDAESSSDNDIDDTAAEALFSWEAAEYCPKISSKVRRSLFDICLTTDLESLSKRGKKKSKSDQANVSSQLARVGYISRCIPFLSIIECHNRISSPKIISAVKRILGEAKMYASSLLFQHPKSMLVVRGVATITAALSYIDPGSYLNDRSNETFELLVPNLAESSHFLRSYTLQVLESYPLRPFVSDHADLDVTDDLDEEPSYRPQTSYEKEISNENIPSSSFLSGACDVISLLRTLESLPVAFPNERKLTSLLTRIDVYARTGKLPIVYAEAVTCHMLGLLHVKFAPIWPAAVKVIVSISTAQEGPAWPFIEEALNRSMQKPPIEDISTGEIITSPRDDPCHVGIITHHQSLCIAWEMSKGKKNDILRPLNDERNAQVSRHAVTDELTLFESIWSILEKAPHLTSTKSKTVVPIFFEFLVSQYYVFHQDEPDSREIDLTDLARSHITWRKEELNRKSIQKKLESFLRVFAAVKGPQQLFKHKLLLQLFVSHLANPDPRLSNLAFSCLLRFKLPYLSPYIDYVQPMLKREGLREALTKFDLSEDSEIVDAEHRLLLVPIVIRILFGRFSARGNGARKSAKDSPTARRAAILSFFSGIGNKEGELNYFVYMMIRTFIPRTANMKNEGVHIEKEPLTRLIEASISITSTEITCIPLKRQEGFLNLLSDVINQIGFGVKDFVHTFTNLLLAISEQTEQALVANIKNQAIKNEPHHDESTFVEHDANAGIGRIRTLTFLRLADIMTKFASSTDFSMHVDRLWKAISSSLIALPNTVINAERPPSLLQLIEAMSSHHGLIPLLYQSEIAVVAVFKCIAGTTRMNVMNCVLRIIGGLLTDGGTLDDRLMSCNVQTTGQTIILQNIHLLIARFTNRLTSISKNVHLDEDVDGSRRSLNKSPKQQNSTDGLQLNILCRVTELLVSATKVNEEHIATMETLCNLLVPLLKFDSHPNQLYVMRTINSLIPSLSTQASMSHFHAISKLLGPNKNNAGVTSKEHRKLLTLAIGAICSRECVCPKWKLVAHAVADLNAASTSFVDEHDFEKMLPVLNGLGGDSQSKGNWLALTKDEKEGRRQMTNEQNTLFDGTRILLPLIYTCFHMLYDPDGVISRSSNKALKCLVTTCSELALSNMDEKDDAHQNCWLKLIEKTVVPCLKIGITTKHLASRRIFILLLSHVANHFVGCKSAHLYGDLRCLIRNDDQELDFFLNLTHVQLHRRTRAFNRLRKMLCANNDLAGQLPLFSDQSFGNILLPLAMHPVYECNSNDEEAYVVEAIATVGEIAKHLPWGKYNSTLQSVLNNLVRYPDQERYLIAMLCAIIDGFHFSVETGDDSKPCEEDRASQLTQGNGVWRSLSNRIIPKVESFLMKEKVDKHGSKNKSLRSSVVLALMKLYQKLPTSIFESKLPKLITCVCNALKNKDSNDRESASDTLSKMAVSLDMKYLPLILSELSISLSEGYKLHVRSATLHLILVSISKVDHQRTAESTEGIATLSLFDRCVPAMLDLIHQDIFGKASEIKDQAGHERRLIKEAMGSKSQDSLEIISRMVCFKPSLATSILKESIPGLTHASVVHAIVTPFLDRLRDPDAPSSTIRKVKECLNRIAFGFSNNSTAKYDEILPFVFATVAPFVYGRTKLRSEEDADLENSDDEEEAPLQVSKSSKSNRAGGSSTINTQKETMIAVAVAHWTPSSIGAAGTQKVALDMKKNQKKALLKVYDGAAAPKLTGSRRHSPIESSTVKTLNNPANACAVSFGLTLLNSFLKRSKLDVSDDKLCGMAAPYLPLLTHCVSFSSDNQAVLLSLRCLGIFLRMDLPSVSKAAEDLGPSILNHLTAAGAATNTQSDIVQSCFKTLTLLISHQKFASPVTQKSTLALFEDENAHAQSNHSEALPLTTDQMQALICLLHSAVREYDHHNSTFGLVKAISSKRYVSSEFYDLMDIILKLTVQSQKSAIRLQSSQIFLQYLLEYPMGTQRFDNHLNQIVLNIKYEYEEGRLAAIDLLSSLIQKFPLTFIESRCQFFFLPLVLQLVNDDARKCKEATADCISLLLQRISTDSAQSLFVYAKRWSQSFGINSLPMQRASAQLLGIFVDSRPDYVKRGSNASDIVSIVQEVITKQDVEDESGWELLYHNLICTEKLQKRMPSLLRLNYELWDALVNLMAYPHPWVMQVSSRIILSHVNEIEPSRLINDAPESFVVKIPECIYKIARNSCRQLDAEDANFVEATSTIAIKTITWTFRAMKQHHNICYNVSHGKNEGSEGDVDLPEKSKDPCLWVMTRLSNIAKPKGSRRRASVFKCFAALCTSCDPQHLSRYLELMIDPIDRDIREATNKLGPDDQPDDNLQIALPKDVLRILEDTCGTEQFIKAFAEVNRKAREKRDRRKQDIASEAVHNPAAAAQRKIMKQVREKERKKRTVEDRRSQRGASKKRRHV
ncbi:hypothetical protein ACHAXA_011727 [Cyclostephanos tholiformis]|uniref:Uncharacterized protein n=1 Tax=Cyclostephanos tholiformis TaxID=382380 RepID=A0ABD3RZI0_9STRA